LSECDRNHSDYISPGINKTKSQGVTYAIQTSKPAAVKLICIPILYSEPRASPKPGRANATLSTLLLPTLPAADITCTTVSFKCCRQQTLKKEMKDE
jgi:hypothetical protein